MRPVTDPAHCSGSSKASAFAPRAVVESIRHHVPPALRLHRLGEAGTTPPMAQMLPLLDDDERLRADRHSTPAHAASFVVGRYLLRLFAAGIVDAEPRALRSDFSCPVCGGPNRPSDHGRPGYSVDGDRLPLSLSLSRAPGAVLLGALDLRRVPDALGGGSSEHIGVDIDAVRSVLFDGFDAVALSRAERTAVADLPERHRDLARAGLWVRKEAVVKSQGTGFSSTGPADVDVLDDMRVTDVEECDGVVLEQLGLVAAVAVL